MAPLLEHQIIEAVLSVTGTGQHALHEPCFRGNEWQYVRDCLDSGYVSSVGKYVDRFENDLASFTGAKYAIAVNNGTAGLHVALKLANVNQGDEVLVPALTFIATANAVNYCNAVPHFVDSEDRSLGLDARALREYLRHISEIRGGVCINRQTGRVIRAVVPMHTFGHPVDIFELQTLARDFHIAIVEDAAESLGSRVSGQHTGTIGLLGVLSFNGNKTITTGGGGAILTNDEGLAKLAKHITTTAKLPSRWTFFHDQIGFNYRLPNLNAALGCAQLEQIEVFVAAQRRLNSLYSAAFKGVEGVDMVKEPDGCHSNYWLQAILLDTTIAHRRDSVLEATNEAGLNTRPAWTLLHELPIFSDCPRMDLPVAESLAARLINLPSSAALGMCD